MTGCDPSAVDSLLERLRNVRRSNLCGSGQFGGRLVPELADGAVLIDCVLLVADGRGERGAGQRQRQNDGPGVPAGAASYESRLRGSLSHPLLTLAENPPRRQGRAGWPCYTQLDVANRHAPAHHKPIYRRGPFQLTARAVRQRSCRCQCPPEGTR